MPVYRALLGAAGTGKSWQLQMESRIMGLKLLATTGVAAINMGGQTLHSWLHLQPKQPYYYMDPSALDQDSPVAIPGIAIDEISMADGPLIQALVERLDDAVDLDPNFLVTICGDFGQLAPVEKGEDGKPNWLFKEQCWERFQDNMTVLTEPKRQDNLEFVEALNLARVGKGHEAATRLKKMGVRFSAGLSPKEGMVLFATNKKVDEYNEMKLRELAKWGKQVWELMDSDGKVGKVAVDAKIMLLNNNMTAVGGEGWANGSTAIVRDIEAATLPSLGYMMHANNTHNAIKVELLDGPSKGETWSVHPAKQYDYETGKTRCWWPLRLAYASTTHKGQGLTLDSVTVVLGEWFSQTGGLMYTALSRVRKPEGLKIVGTVEQLAGRIQCDEEAKRWL